jgi:hypothetical protein
LSDLSWLLILLLSTVFVGTCMYHFGHAIGREQEKLDSKNRASAMRRHPSHHLRSVKRPE